MTSEIVIMNKMGLSMAADSAITSGQEGVKKVYNSANKLFALSEKHPIGIMVYGAASFMEVPWAVIIKSYRDHLGDKTFPYLDDYVTHFIDFLKYDERFKQESIEDIIVYRTFSDIIKQIVKEVEVQIENCESEPEQSTVVKWMTMCIVNYIETYKKQKQSMVNMTFSAFKERFNHILTEVSEEFISFTIPHHVKQKLNQLAFQVSKKDFFSAGSTGFVIAGYGEEAIFPQLLNYRLEGFISGQLKYKKIKERKISYINSDEARTASITPFAQRDMVDLFIDGIEPNMEDAIFNIIDEVIGKYQEQIQKHVPIEFSEEQVKTLEKMGKEIVTTIIEAVEEYKQDHYYYPLLSIVRSLPVSELANMTEALLNLTSFKQRMTRMTESVSPPIDVAVITKGDGFVWMKKKNLVNKFLNE